MAGTMMKTRRRVKRTVREMPRRLTIRLSKGSNRNMVEDPGKASAPPTSRTNHRLQMVLSDSTSLGKKVSPHRTANPIPGSQHLTAWGQEDVKRATGGSPKMPALPRIDGLWR